MIGQNLTGISSCGKFMQHLESCLLWQSFVSTCDVFNCLFPLDVQNEIQLVSRVFCYSWILCLLAFWLRDPSLAGAYQMEPPSPLISWVNPFPSRFINRTASFPRKVSYFRESRVSPWKNKIGWSRTQKPVLRPFSFFTIRPFLQFYSRWDLGVMK